MNKPLPSGLAKSDIVHMYKWQQHCSYSFAKCQTKIGCFGCCSFDVMTKKSLLFIYKLLYFYLNHLMSLFFVLHWLFNLWLSFSTIQWIYFWGGAYHLNSWDVFKIDVQMVFIEVLVLSMVFSWNMLLPMPHGSFKWWIL
jgi:hypothetical protein